MGVSEREQVKNLKITPKNPKMPESPEIIGKR